MIALRPIQLPADQRAVLQLDTSFTTDRVYRVQVTPTSFTLLEDVVHPPLHKFFALDHELDADRMWEYGIVAEDNNTIVGFVALRSEHWNRRTAIGPESSATDLDNLSVDAGANAPRGDALEGASFDEIEGPAFSRTDDCLSQRMLRLALH